MSSAAIYLAAGLAIFLLGAAGLFLHTQLIRRALALNFMGTGVFLFLVALGRRPSAALVDAIPHALVLTGLVIAVGTTALLLVLICRFLETEEPATRGRGPGLSQAARPPQKPQRSSTDAER